ncbi:MAG: M14 family zinc carboxypeptidase [Myxococcota bacterium]|jgi:hypothetical protein|nr:M14 family zinc carboxypeptidase [Myxococcota bacterium]
MEGSRRLITWLGFVGVALLFSAEPLAIPAIEPAEKVLFGPSVLPQADTHGSWASDGDRLRLLEAAGDGQAYWFPIDADASFNDGFVRARFELGKRMDGSLLFRVQGDPIDYALLDGYALDIAKDTVSFVRWDRGVMRQLDDELKLSKLSKLDSIELVLWFVGPFMTAQLYDGEKLKPLGSLVVSDSQYTGGRVGLRAFKKQDAETALTLLSVARASTAHLIEPEVVGPERYLRLGREDLDRIPKHAKWSVIQELGEATLVQASRRDAELIARAGIRAQSIEAESSYWHTNADYREAKRRSLEEGSAVSLDASYLDAEMIELVLRDYARRYPEQTRLVELGRSHRGAPIWALKLSSEPDDEDRPAVLLNGGHHGLELLTSLFVLDAVQQLLENPEGLEQVSRWMKGLEIWAVPLVNPDGNLNFMQHSIYSGRKNGRDSFLSIGRFACSPNTKLSTAEIPPECRDDTFTSLVFDSLSGVDLNRNYPFRWNTGGEKTSNSSSRHVWYRGPFAGSEPETQAMMRLADARHFVASISYHTMASAILVPYTIDDTPNPEPNEAWTVAEEIAAQCPEQVKGKHYKVRRNLYSVDGVDQDWLRAAHGTVALLVEGVLHNPSGDRRRESVVLNRCTWQGLFARIVEGPSVYGNVKDESGNPVLAQISLEEQQLSLGERWMTRCSDGRYERMLEAPGRYTVVARVGEQELRQTVKLKAGQRKRVDFVFESLELPAMDRSLCAEPSMCAAATLCEARAGRCVQPGMQALSCIFDGECVADGEQRGAKRCDAVRFALEPVMEPDTAQSLESAAEPEPSSDVPKPLAAEPKSLEADCALGSSEPPQSAATEDPTRSSEASCHVQGLNRDARIALWWLAPVLLSAAGLRRNA